MKSILIILVVCITSINIMFGSCSSDAQPCGAVPTCAGIRTDQKTAAGCPDNVWGSLSTLCPKMPKSLLPCAFPMFYPGC